MTMVLQHQKSIHRWLGKCVLHVEQCFNLSLSFSARKNFNGISVPLSNIHIVLFVNTKSAWHLYSFILNSVKKSAIFINDVDPVVFHVSNDDVAGRIAAKAVRFKVTVCWNSLVPEAQHASGVRDNHGSDIRHTDVAITILGYVGRADK